MSVRKSPKIQKLVVNAIRKLQDVQGSTPREISNYISQEYDVPNTKIQRQVRLALARALSYGILQRSKGGYYTCNRELIGCEPQMEDAQPTEKCGGGRRMRRGKSSRRRRRGGGGGSCKRPMRRKRGRRGGVGCGRKSRRRSRRRGRSSGGCGSGRKSRRRSRRGKSGCGGGRRGRRKGGRSSGGGRRKRRRSRGRRGGKQCGGSSMDKRGGKAGDDIFATSAKKRRARSFSGGRNENRSGSVSLSVSDECLDDKASDGQPTQSPETLLD